MSHSPLPALKGKNAFEGVFRQCRKYSSGSVTAHIRFRPQPELHGLPRTGLMMRKKLMPTAVLRNRCKRLVREALRHIAAERPELLAGMEAVIVSWNTRMVAQPSTLRLQDVLIPLQSIIEQAARTSPRRTLS